MDIKDSFWWEMIETLRERHRELFKKQQLVYKLVEEINLAFS